jgi:hypothetical protein
MASTLMSKCDFLSLQAKLSIDDTPLDWFVLQEYRELGYRAYCILPQNVVWLSTATLMELVLLLWLIRVHIIWDKSMAAETSAVLQPMSFFRLPMTIRLYQPFKVPTLFLARSRLPYQCSATQSCTNPTPLAILSQTK